jgi:hypothetical protein
MTREELKWVIYERTLNSVDEHVLDCILELIAAEREACAQVAEAWDADHTDTNYGLCIGNAIRARGSK